MVEDRVSSRVKESVSRWFEISPRIFMSQRPRANKCEKGATKSGAENLFLKASVGNNLIFKNFPRDCPDCPNNKGRFSNKDDNQTPLKLSKTLKYVNSLNFSLNALVTSIYKKNYPR